MDILVSVPVPPEVEQRIAAEAPRLSTVAREAVAIDLFRRGLLSHAQLGQALGLDRFETDAFLKRLSVAEFGPRHDQIDGEVARFDRISP